MTKPGFEEVVHSSVQEAMSRILGGEVWKAVSFYFDVKLAAREPRSFENLLDKLFGSSSKVLQQMIGTTLMSRVGGRTDSVKGREFSDLIQMAMARFSSHASSTLSPVG